MSEHYDLGSPRCVCSHSQMSHDDGSGECYVHPSFLGDQQHRCPCADFEAVDR
jgi:hypothetical protein